MAKRGPNTAAGKAVVSLNAVRHGALSRALIIPGVERQEDFDALHQGLIDDFEPQGEFEFNLVELMTTSLWRLRRIGRYEVQTISVGLERVEENFLWDNRYSPKPHSVDEGEANLRKVQDSLALLHRLRSMPSAEPLTASLAVGLVDAFADEDDKLLAVVLPSLPTIDDREAFKKWTAGLVLRTAVSIAEQLETTLDELFDDVIEHAEDIEKQREAELVEVIARLDRMRRERQLPDDAKLQNVSRYEAHVSKQFYQALHELEAAKLRRRGEPTPLSRVQVHGLPG